MVLKIIKKKKKYIMLLIMTCKNSKGNSKILIY